MPDPEAMPVKFFWFSLGFGFGVTVAALVAIFVMGMHAVGGI